MYDAYCPCLNTPRDNTSILWNLEAGGRIPFCGVCGRKERHPAAWRLSSPGWGSKRMARGTWTCAGTSLAGGSGVLLLVCRRPALLGLVASRGAFLILELEKADVRERLGRKQSVFLPSVPKEELHGPLTSPG